MYILQNNKDRTFNWIKFKWIINVDENRKNYLLENWFKLLVDNSWKKEKKVEKKKVTLKKVVVSDKDNSERLELLELYETLAWKKAHPQIWLDKLKEKISELEK